MGLYLVIVIYLMRRKKLTSTSAKLKFSTFSFLKQTTFVSTLITYPIALLVLKVQDLTGKRDWHCVLFLQLFLGNTVFTRMQDEVLA
jgi:hypothetical protein